MFQSETSEKFAIGRTMMPYVVLHGLGPAVLEGISKDINASVGCITLLLDETTTAQLKKQYDFLIQYWSEELFVQDTLHQRCLVIHQLNTLCILHLMF